MFENLKKFTAGAEISRELAVAIIGEYMAFIIEFATKVANLDEKTKATVVSVIGKEAATALRESMACSKERFYQLQKYLIMECAEELVDITFSSYYEIEKLDAQFAMKHGEQKAVSEAVEFAMESIVGAEGFLISAETTRRLMEDEPRLTERYLDAMFKRMGVTDMVERESATTKINDVLRASCEVR